MSRFPAAFRLPAFRFSVIRCPPRNSALLTVGLPDLSPDLDGVTAFRTHELRPGWVPSIPRGRRCSSRSEDRAQPAPAALPRLALRPCSSIPSAGIRLTRHQRGFKQFTRPACPSPVAARMERAALGLPPSFTPRRPGADESRRSGAKGAIEHEPGTTLTTSAEPPILRVHSIRATSRRTDRCDSLVARRPNGSIDPVAVDGRAVACWQENSMTRGGASC